MLVNWNIQHPTHIFLFISQSVEPGPPGPPGPPGNNVSKFFFDSRFGVHCVDYYKPKEGSILLCTMIVHQFGHMSLLVMS